MSKVKACLLMAVIYILPTGSRAEFETAGLTVQFSGNDLATIRNGIEESLQSGPVSGISSEPMQSPYAFGTITARDISYEFQPSLGHLTLLHTAFGFDLTIHNFRGVVGRVDFNDSGSMYCKSIPVHSGSRGDQSIIPVHVIAVPQVQPDGTLSLALPVSDVGLTNDNFIVEEPAECNVVYGLNWLVKWVVPSLISNYKKEVAKGLSKALANALKDRSGEMTPLLGLNITLPFEPLDIPAFYATVAVRPQQFSITPDRFQSIFATSVTIDPDRIVPLSSNADWPSDLSLLGFSWDLLGGILREAQSKNILKATITSQSHAGSSWTDHSRWRNIWPQFDEVVPAQAPLKLELLGGVNYQWSANPNNTSEALLHVTGFHAALSDQHRNLANFFADLDLSFLLSSTPTGAIKAELRQVIFLRERFDLKDSPLAQLETRISGIKQLKDQLIRDIETAPAAQRELFYVAIPSIKFGSHQVIIREIRSHEAGVILPLRYVAPQ